MQKDRLERDPLGDVRVPARALYGAQTQRAVDNFPISGLTAHPELVTATVQIKKAAARANAELGRLDQEIGRAIVEGADEILEGAHREQFVVDVYQAGAGTSHNMNTNEVLANLAEEKLGGRRGTYKRVHPNDHVNMGQSTNDVFPTATRLAVLDALPGLLESGHALAASLEEKCESFASVLKTGRTHLQDAVPITLGQEFGGLAANVRQALADLDRTSQQLHELNLGATALGTGLNAGEEYTHRAVAHLVEATGLPLRPAEDRFRVTQSMGDLLAVSGALRRLAVEVGKVASDLRLLSMGPRAGIAEIQLPPGPAGLLDHAGEGQPLDPGDGQPGLLPGPGVRCDHPGSRRQRAARTERDDAGHGVERAARRADPRQRHARPRPAVRDGDPGRRGPLPRAAGPQYSPRHRAQPSHRIR